MYISFMARQKLSNNQKKILQEKNAQKASIKSKEKKQFNLQFHKTPLFVSSWIIRLCCLIFFITAIALQHTTSTINKEVLIKRLIKLDLSFFEKTQIISTLYITTNKGNYKGDISAKKIPKFNVGDTMLIQKNVFGKPTFFTRKHWPYKYELDYGLEAYYIVIFLTLISMGFNDVTDQITKKLLWIFMIIDLIAIFLFYIF